MALVFDFVDCAEVSPVSGFYFDAGGGEEWAIDVTVLKSKDGKILFFSPVSEFVEAELVRGLSHVVLLNRFVVTDELVEAVLVLSNVVVCLAELGDEGEEGTLGLIEGDSGGS